MGPFGLGVPRCSLSRPVRSRGVQKCARRTDVADLTESGSAGPYSLQTVFPSELTAELGVGGKCLFTQTPRKGGGVRGVWGSALRDEGREGSRAGQQSGGTFENPTIPLAPGATRTSAFHLLVYFLFAV